ncbi:MAG: 2-hydroxychromene-2-carboxylate isomerase [Burkholderiales bacterium]|nr:MAG: 2-hydroxychromene-2-carboxylate isomerase [Burkholderiales bacterium]
MGPDTHRIECFFDCSSPWTYLCFHNLQLLAAELDVAVIWRPFLVGGVFNAVNPSVYESRRNPVPAKARYMLKNLQDWARLAGLQIRFPPPVFPVNSVKAMRACLLLEGHGKLVPFARACFEAYFGAGRDISGDAVLAELCRDVDVEPQWLFEGIGTASIKDQLRANTDELIARGGFGSPTMFVGGDDMYFGNDSLPLVRAALRRETPQRP